ncbi:MAG: hypothetical protein N2037_08145 [Acidimicrobiales bacterium]|nr:hypothetical protein [Acidimicrobiales bacterium]
MAAQVDCSFYLYDLNLYLACIGGAQIGVSSTPVPCPGGPLTVTITGWKPDSTVSVTLTSGSATFNGPPITVGSDSTGTVTFNIPANFPAGPATLTVSGTALGETRITRDIPVEINATCEGGGGSSVPTGDQGGGNLPRTGSDTGRLVGLGAALIVIGAAAVYGALRSKGQPATGNNT